MKKMISMLLALVMALSLGGMAALAEEAQTIDLSGHIVILHTSDAHGWADGNLGYSRVAVAKERLEGAGATVLLLDAGDGLYGRAFANLSEGDAIVKLMNVVGYDAMGLGSHDFAYGAEWLAALVEGAEFPVLAANVTKEDGTAFLDGAAVIEKGNVKFGIFALTGGAAEGLIAADPIEAAQAQVAALEAEDCTIIIALNHSGLTGTGVDGRSLAGQVAGIDVIVEGGSHDALESGEWVNSTLVVNAGAYIENIGCVDIDAEGNAAATLLTGEDFGEADVDAEIDSLIAERKTAQQEQMSAVVGQSSVELDGSDAALTGETNLGSLAADALRNAADADAALLDGGSLRASIPAGDITKSQLAEVFPAGGCGVVQSVTGEQLAAALEAAVSEEAEGGFPQVSGMTFKYDAAQPVGSRVFEVKIGGEALDPAKTYRVAVSEEKLIEGAAVEAELDALDEILTAYIDSFEAAIAPEIEGRSLAEAKPAE